jgi:hypothetical protein
MIIRWTEKADIKSTRKYYTDILTWNKIVAAVQKAGLYYYHLLLSGEKGM